MTTMQRKVTARVNALIQDPLQGTTAVLLEGIGERSILPIWIGLPEAVAISQALTGKRSPRPLTHRLLQNTITSLEGKLHRIEVTRLEHDTFFAVLQIKTGNHMVLVDARPSDAIALAIYARVPILIAESVWQSASIPLERFGMTPHPRKLRPVTELKTRLKHIRAEEAKR